MSVIGGCWAAPLFAVPLELVANRLPIAFAAAAPLPAGMPKATWSLLPGLCTAIVSRSAALSQPMLPPAALLHTEFPQPMLPPAAPLLAELPQLMLPPAVFGSHVLPTAIRLPIVLLRLAPIPCASRAAPPSPAPSSVRATAPGASASTRTPLRGRTLRTVASKLNECAIRKLNAAKTKAMPAASRAMRSSSSRPIPVANMPLASPSAIPSPRAERTMHSTGRAPAGLRAPIRAISSHMTRANSEELISHSALETSVRLASPMHRAGTSNSPASVRRNDSS